MPEPDHAMTGDLHAGIEKFMSSAGMGLLSGTAGN